MNYSNANRGVMAPSPTPSHSKRIDKKKFTHVSSEPLGQVALPREIPVPHTESGNSWIGCTEPRNLKLHVLKELARGDHMALFKYKYVDASGTQKDWEVAERCKKSRNQDSDSVCSLPILRRMLKYDCLVLVKQYRPSVKAFTLEFPTGLVDIEDTTPQQCALRRLNSQTGYTSTGVKQVSPLTASDPVHTACTTKIISVDVNGDDLRNLNAKQQLQEGVPVKSRTETGCATALPS